MAITRVVGLDIGASSVKAAQVLRQSDGTFVVEAQASKQLPRGAMFDGRVIPIMAHHVADTIRELFDTADFATNQVVIGLNSSSAVFMEEIEVPDMDPSDYAQAIPNIIRANSPATTGGDMEYSFSIAGETETDNGTMLRVLVYRASADYVEELSKVVESANLEVVGVDVSALATLRASNLMNRPTRQVDALVDIGANVVSILVHHDGVPRMLTLDPNNAGEEATARIAQSLELDETDEVGGAAAEWHKIHDTDQYGLVAQARHDYARALSSRIASTLQSFLSRNNQYVDSIASVTLLGGGAQLLHLGHFLSESLKDVLQAYVPMNYARVDERILPGKGSSSVERQDAQGGDYFVAIGLGTGAVL